ncbi:Benzyl alcohol o-benzoyltransferase [Thalictrum thalictroides]|uniref:Benzyl alcohol o-benzoyltransferase n=1 Tax=Thalictrum thalictroides TaxID=46969 RepID=A0A7J6VFM6_THATH|nr:Benzyl alcohol o-benzoyltransferase [Thalictrum thalictroides]
MTPIEFKYLSNFDDQTGLQNHIPFIHFYHPRNGMVDPVPLIRVALSKALVHYYPIAGRLRKADKGKLVVDCCGEGVIFREGKVDVTLAELLQVEGGLKPPFPQLDCLLVDDVWGSNLITDSPLLRMQVTRLACGGFILAYTFNHCVCDAYGALQFVTVVSEFCLNPDLITPSIIPSWGREILRPRYPPKTSYHHPEYDRDHLTETPSPTETDFKCLTQTSIFFSKADISSLKNQINGGKCATFDAIASCLWKARTKTLIKPDTVTKLLFPIDTRVRSKPVLPKNYYGTAVVFPCVSTKASELIEKPIQYVAKLVSDMKNGVIGDEYRASVLDFIELNERRGFCSEGAFVVSDQSRLRFVDVDFGWGSGVYGGPARAGTGLVPGMVTSIIGYKNEKGVEGLLALVSLPSQALETFHNEVKKEIGSVIAISAL